jgi:hypothetical protein
MVVSYLQVMHLPNTIEETENFITYKITNCKHFTNFSFSEPLNLFCKFSVISDFGGLLGLFMGCSLISIVETFYFITNGFFDILRRRKTSPENEKSSNAKWAQKVESKSLLEELKNEMTQLKKEIKSEVKNEMAQFKTEVRNENVSIRTDLVQLRSEIFQLRNVGIRSTPGTLAS